MRGSLELQVILDSRFSRGRSLVEVAREAIAGGATAIQLRGKEFTTRQLLKVGQEIRQVTHRAGMLFIVNDRADVALALEADGVHLGQDDLPAGLARKILGEDRLIGISVGYVAEALQAEREGADYVSVGSIFATISKDDAGEPTGPALIKEVKRAVRIPVVAIGGINANNVLEVIISGADGVAVISAVVSASDVREASYRLRQAITAALKLRSG
ncbi:MAG: thiamine phosphate synthase [Chloroflexi bacterium]|nr:thiamine phosphate synthase [Chloroflexota bacterium]MCL5075589.1 thiamine phosphate synthase [Chloroflexota bacterium]